MKQAAGRYRCTLYYLAVVVTLDLGLTILDVTGAL